MTWRRRKSREHDLERELRAHLDLETAEHLEAGLPPEAAHYAAQRALGNTALLAVYHTNCACAIDPNLCETGVCKKQAPPKKPAPPKK
jgi:hypothetical protein